MSIDLVATEFRFSIFFKYSLMKCQVCWQSPEWLLMRLIYHCLHTSGHLFGFLFFLFSPCVGNCKVCVRTMSCLALRRKRDGAEAVYAFCRSSLFVSWCFEPSQPKRITLITFDADLLRMTFILGSNYQGSRTPNWLKSRYWSVLQCVCSTINEIVEVLANTCLKKMVLFNLLVTLPILLHRGVNRVYHFQWTSLVFHEPDFVIMHSYTLTVYPQAFMPKPRIFTGVHKQNNKIR